MDDEIICPTCKLIWRIMVLATMLILVGMAWVKMGSKGPPAAVTTEEVQPT